MNEMNFLNSSHQHFLFKYLTWGLSLWGLLWLGTPQRHLEVGYFIVVLRLSSTVLSFGKARGIPGGNLLTPVISIKECLCWDPCYSSQRSVSYWCVPWHPGGFKVVIWSYPSCLPCGDEGEGEMLFLLAPATPVVGEGADFPLYQLQHSGKWTLHLS